ncbi:MAG: glycosyltransferase family 39 protein [Terrimicrobiaceae bacterium]|nr:glycosyltransferase family 39 protein [Terrimicrobiaceae bacterium]
MQQLDTAPDVRRPARFEALRDGIWPVAVAAFAGIATLIFGVVAFEVSSNQRASLPGIFSRWDTPHYESIAANGYSPGSGEDFRICFFPLFPWLARLFLWLPGGATTAVLVVANLACILACLALYRLGRLELGEEGAKAAVLALLAAPVAYFLHLGYTESLFLAGSIGSFLFARRGHWVAAGLCAFVATLTRMTGVALVPALLFEWAHQAGFKPSRLRWSGLAVLSPAAAIGIYLWLNVATFGDPFHFLKMQATHFFREFSWPWIGLMGDVRGLSTAEPTSVWIICAAHVIAFVLGTAGVIWTAIALRPSYAIYAAGIWILTFCYSFWMSVPRLLFAMFPVFLLAGIALRGRSGLSFCLAFVSLLAYGLGLTQFVRGWWAH